MWKFIQDCFRCMWQLYDQINIYLDILIIWSEYHKTLDKTILGYVTHQWRVNS